MKVPLLKKHIWKILTDNLSYLPAKILSIICRVCIRSIAKKCCLNRIKTLVQIHDFSLWNIDQLALQIEGGIHPKHRLIGYHDFFVKHVKPGDKILDVGCGNGAVSYSMASAGAYVTGFDLDQRSIEFGKKYHRHPRLKLFRHDLREFSNNDSFDVVVMSNVLEHMEHRVDILKQLCRQCNPKRFLIRVPMIDRDWLVPYKKELGMYYYSDPTHVTEYTLGTFIAEMKSAELSINEITVRWGEIWASLTPDIN